MAVGEDQRQARRQRVDDRDVGDPLIVGAKRQRLAHDLIDVDHRPRRLTLPREGEQIADDARGPFGFAADGLEPAADGGSSVAFWEMRSAQLRMVASGLFSS